MNTYQTRLTDKTLRPALILIDVFQKENKSSTEINYIFHVEGAHKGTLSEHLKRRRPSNQT